MTQPKGKTSELSITKADQHALERLPQGWFEWFEAGYMVRCPEFRLGRLVDRGLVERKIVGKYPDSHWEYRKL
jgi:hypothetical protein